MIKTFTIEPTRPRSDESKVRDYQGGGPVSKTKRCGIKEGYPFYFHHCREGVSIHVTQESFHGPCVIRKRSYILKGSYLKTLVSLYQENDHIIKETI